MTPPPETLEPHELVDRVCDLLDADDLAGIAALLGELPHASDVAQVLEALGDEDRTRVLSVVVDAQPAVAAEALAEMEPEEHPEETLASLEPEQIAAVVAELSDDDAADILGELEADRRHAILSALPVEDAGDIRSLLRYDEESAGGRMTAELVVVPLEMSATEAIGEVRRQGQEVGDFWTIFVVDDRNVLQGSVSLKRLVTARADARVADLVREPVVTVPPGMDQEEVGRILSRYNLAVVPVVTADGRLLGGVTFDDVIDVLEAETTEDLLKFSGASDEEEIRGGWWDAVRARAPWLLLNLMTASIGAAIVTRYEDTVQTLPALAALMPMVAGLGGNSGTQALAVTIRRLALSQESAARRWSIVGKELLVGLGNGLVIGLLIAILATTLEQDVRLGGVVMAAMWMNLTVGSFAGAFVPIVLERLNVDPAAASSVFVTAFTDAVGFLLLLGLATRVLL